MNIVELKENARKSLQGKYGQAITMIIVLGVITGAASVIPVIFKPDSELTASIISSVCTIISAVLSSFFILGSVSFYLKISRNEEVTWKELFSKTNLWLVCLLSTILVNIFVGLWSLLLIIPGIIAAYSYSMVQFILVDNENLTALEAMKKSKEMMNGHKMELFKLHISFLGWIILSVFTFGILFFWLAPYVSTATANFYNKIK